MTKITFVEQVKISAIGARLLDLSLVEGGRIDRQKFVDGCDILIALCEKYDGTIPSESWLADAILKHKDRTVLIQTLKEIGYLPPSE